MGTAKTQALGDRAGVHYVTISKLERHMLPGVSADTLVRLVLTLGVSTDFLLGLTDEGAEAGSGRPANA